MLKKILLPAAAVWLMLAAGCGDSLPPEPEWQMNIIEETVLMEGLKEEYDLLFVTDIHAVIRDGKEEQAVREYGEERYPMFLNGEGVDSQTQFEAYIRYANEKGVDGVILGGDIIDSPSQANLDWLGKQLGRLEMPYLYVPGNHDWTYPWEYMTPEGERSYLSLLEPFTRGNTEINTLDMGEFTVVGVNSSKNQVSEAVFPEFDRLYGQGKPLIVVTHVPFLTQSVLGRAREVWSSPTVIGGGNFGGIYPNEYSERLVDLITATDSSVEMVLAGHVHFYDRDVIEGEKDVTQRVGAAGYEGNIMLIHIRGAE